MKKSTSRSSTRRSRSRSNSRTRPALRINTGTSVASNLSQTRLMNRTSSNVSALQATSSLTKQKSILSNATSISGQKSTLPRSRSLARRRLSNVKTLSSNINTTNISNVPSNAVSFPNRPRSRSTSSVLRTCRNLLPPNLKLHKRNLVTSYIGRNKETNLWTVTIEATKDSKYTLFTFPTEEEAKEAAYAYSPPKMMSFESNPVCHLCDSKFQSLVRRPSNCRNCGVCICNTCSVDWKKSMLPDTYLAKNNTKKNVVSVCKTCDYLATEFRCALLDGRYKHALKVYMTGNINLRYPLANVNNGMEIMYPIHCAASSDSVELTRWLIDKHKCPYQNTAPRPRAGNPTTSSKQLIATSNGRTILDIALSKNNIDLMTYLVKEKKIELSSQNSGNDREAAWKVLSSMLNDKNEEGNRLGKHPSIAKRNASFDSRVSVGTANTNLSRMSDALKSYQSGISYYQGDNDWNLFSLCEAFCNDPCDVATCKENFQKDDDHHHEEYIFNDDVSIATFDNTSTSSRELSKNREKKKGSKSKIRRVGTKDDETIQSGESLKRRVSFLKKSRRKKKVKSKRNDEYKDENNENDAFSFGFFNDEESRNTYSESLCF